MFVEPTVGDHVVLDKQVGVIGASEVLVYLGRSGDPERPYSFRRVNKQDPFSLKESDLHKLRVLDGI